MTTKKLIALLLAMMLLCTCMLTGCQDSPEALAKKAKNTVAVTVLGHKINAVQLNFFYTEMINSFVNDYSYYVYYMMDVYSPLDQQVFDEESGQTWADRFLEMALTNLKGTYILYDAALKAGLTLNEDQENEVAAVMESLSYYATQYKFDSVDAYLTNLFGYGADAEAYEEYYRINLLADAYYAQHYESLDFSVEELAAYEAKNATTFNSYSFAYYTLYTSKYLKGGTEDSSGNVTYSDEQKALAIVDAELDAKALAAGKYANAAEFNAAIAQLPVNTSIASVVCTEKTDLLYSEVSSTFSEWIGDSQRIAGDTTVIAKTITDSTNNTTTIDGYYVLVFLGCNDNRFNMKNVRHVLVQFEGGKTDSSGVTTYTDEEKAAAKAEAEALLEQWKSGAATEASFAELANKESDDRGGKVTNGGLYENIQPGQMVANFDAWCYDPQRVAGDYGIVETEYGYHLMYFVGNTTMTYRDYMVLTVMRSESISAWYNEMLESTTVKTKNLDFVNTSMILANA